MGGAPKPGENRMNRVVVLKGMFKLEDLEKDPALLLELKEEVRDEAETLGTVTSVVLFDVRFFSSRSHYLEFMSLEMRGGGEITRTFLLMRMNRKRKLE